MWHLVATTGEEGDALDHLLACRGVGTTIGHGVGFYGNDAPIAHGRPAAAHRDRMAFVVTNHRLLPIPDDRHRTTGAPRG